MSITKRIFTAAIALVMITATAMAAGSRNSSYTYKVVAWNDLGMHCVCPGFDTFMLLPPYNTVRAQVFAYGPNDPIVVDSTFATNNGLSITYGMLENTDTSLINDPNFQSWIKNAPKLFPGFQPVVNGVVQGLAGKGLYGSMDYNSTLLNWRADGIPAYPNLDANGPMTDPTGGTNRNPYLTGNVYVKDASGKVLAQTSTVVPAAFGGCCGCHLKLASVNGYSATPAGSFQYMGYMHGRNSSKINFAYIDPDGDGVGGPIRCSWCHWDPAMGEARAPGVPAGYKILAGASFTTTDVKTSQYSFSDVLHRFHSQSQVVLTQYDANIANNCYACHPGNNIECYRGAHKGKTLWCSDCHGNLNQRVATGQMANPWSQSTLPSCSAPSTGINSAFACHPTTVATGQAYSGLFGKYLNGRGHKGSVDCQTCHGEPHALAPSTLAKDNVQLSNLQGSTAYSFPAGKDKTNALGVCNFCHPSKTTTWGQPPHIGKQAM